MEKRAETVGDFTPPTDLPALMDIGREEEDWGPTGTGNFCLLLTHQQHWFGCRIKRY